MADELTEPAKTAIRSYMFKLVVPTGIVLSVASALGGFLLNEVARGAAYSKAYGDAMSSVIRTTSDATSARANAEESARAAGEKAKEAQKTVEQINSNIGAADSIVRSLLGKVELQTTLS